MPSACSRQRRVAHVAGEDVRGERLERQVRVLDGPQRIARVEAGADEIRAGGLDQYLQLARLHIAGMILDGDLQAGVDDLRLDGAQHFNGVLDVLLERDLAVAVGGAAEEATYDFRPYGGGRGGGASELFLGGPLLGIEEGRGGADGAHAELDFDAELRGVGANLLQILGFQAADEAQFAEVDHFQARFRAEIEVLERGPVLRAETEEVEAEFDVGGGGGARGLEQRGGAGGEERATVHGGYCIGFQPSLLSCLSRNAPALRVHISGGEFVICDYRGQAGAVCRPDHAARVRICRHQDAFQRGGARGFSRACRKGRRAPTSCASGWDCIPAPREIFWTRWSRCTCWSARTGGIRTRRRGGVSRPGKRRLSRRNPRNVQPAAVHVLGITLGSATNGRAAERSEGRQRMSSGPLRRPGPFAGVSGSHDGHEHAGRGGDRREVPLEGLPHVRGYRHGAGARAGAARDGARAPSGRRV